MDKFPASNWHLRLTHVVQMQNVSLKSRSYVSNHFLFISFNCSFELFFHFFFIEKLFLYIFFNDNIYDRKTIKDRNEPQLSYKEKKNYVDSVILI